MEYCEICDINRSPLCIFVHILHSATSGQTLQRVPLIRPVLLSVLYLTLELSNQLLENTLKIRYSIDFFKDPWFCCMSQCDIQCEEAERHIALLTVALLDNAAFLGSVTEELKIQLNFLSCVRLQEADKQ